MYLITSSQSLVDTTRSLTKLNQNLKENNLLDNINLNTNNNNQQQHKKAELSMKETEDNQLEDIYNAPMYFGTENSTRITTQIGATAHLPCTIHHIGEGVVSFPYIMYTISNHSINVIITKLWINVHLHPI